MIATESITDIYEVGDLLGSGSFGTVRIARRKKDGQEYAIKRIQLPADEKKRCAVEREANALYNLKHEHIVNIHFPTYTFKEGLGSRFQIHMPLHIYDIINYEFKCCGHRDS